MLLIMTEASSGSGNSLMPDNEGASTSNVTVYFESSSLIGERRCALFETVKDLIVETDEVMAFNASARNALDVFVGDSRTFSLTVNDDDGMC